MSVFKKQKRIEITIALVVFALAIVGGLLFIFLDTLPSIEKLKDYSVIFEEKGDLKEVESLRESIIWRMIFALLMFGMCISFSNFFTSLIFRSFTRLIPKYLGPVTAHIFVFLHIVLGYIATNLPSNNISGFVVIIAADFFVLSLTYVYFYIAFKAKKEYF